MNSTASAQPANPRLHEWPLVLFTTLAIMGAGLLATPLLAAIVSGTPAVAWALMPVGALLLAAGLAVSLAHLGRPARAPLAARAIGRSRLSTEAVTGGLTLLVGGTAALLPYVSPILDLAAALCAIAFLVSLGLVYSLPGQQTWRGAVVAMPLTMGLGFGAVALAGMWDQATVAVGGVAAAVLAADVALLLFRRLAIAWPREPFAPRHPAIFANRQWWLAARLILIDLLPGGLVLAGLPKGAAGALALGILVDRLSFYGLAAQATTEAEIGRVEEFMGA